MRLKRQICLMTLFMMCIFGCCQFVYAEEAETPVEFEYTIYESRNENAAVCADKAAERID